MNSAGTAQDHAGAPLGAPVYELSRVSKTYARNSVVALEDVSLTLRKGSFTTCSPILTLPTMMSPC